MPKKREKALELLRGFAMLQVVFVHNFYWLKLFENGGFFITSHYELSFCVIRSFFLFEMPLLFFVTGAANEQSPYRGYISFCKKRISKIMIPYFIYAAICIVISLIGFASNGSLTLRDAGAVTLSWLVPLGFQKTPNNILMQAMWFIPVYILTVLLFPLVQKAKERFPVRRVFLAEFLIFFFAEFIILHLLNPVRASHAAFRACTDFLLEALFYIIFVTLGTQYRFLKINRKRCRYAAAAVFAVSLTGLFAAVIMHADISMQTNKFPTTHIFLLYAFAVLSFFYLMMPLMKKLYRAIVKRLPAFETIVLFFSQNSIYVFLYQSFPFVILAVLLRRYVHVSNDFYVFIPCLLLSFALVYFLCKGIVFVQNKCGAWLAKKRRN